jgi:hypothetical protein
MSSALRSFVIDIETSFGFPFDMRPKGQRLNTRSGCSWPDFTVTSATGSSPDIATPVPVRRHIRETRHGRRAKRRECLTVTEFCRLARRYGQRRDVVQRTRNGLEMLESGGTMLQLLQKSQRNRIRFGKGPTDSRRNRLT